jgi:hypothetical protein
MVLSVERSDRTVAYVLRDTIRATLPPHIERVESANLTFRSIPSGVLVCAVHVGKKSGVRLYFGTDGLRAPAGVDLQGAGATGFVEISSVEQASGNATVRLIKRIGNLRRA